MVFNLLLLILVFINVSSPGNIERITKIDSTKNFTLEDFNDHDNDASEEDLEENSIEAELHFIPVILGQRVELLVTVHEGELPTYMCRYIQQIQVPPAAQA